MVENECSNDDFFKLPWVNCNPINLHQVSVVTCTSFRGIFDPKEYGKFFSLNFLKAASDREQHHTISFLIYFGR